MPDTRPPGSKAPGPAKPLDSHFRMAPVFAGQLAWTLGVCVVMAGACLAVGFSQSLPSARALGLYLALVASVVAALWRMVSLRGAVSLEREARAEARRKEEERAKTGKQSLFAGEPEDIPRHWTSEFKLEGYAHARQRIVLLVPAVGIGIVAFLYLIRPVPGLKGSVLAVGALELVIGFACILASRYFGLVGARGIREAPALAGWLRGAQWLSFAAAISLFFAGMTKSEYPDVERWICRIILAWTVLSAAELIGRAVSGFFGERRAYEDADVPIELISLQLAFASANPLKSLEEGIEKYLGISLQASWGLRFLGRSFLPLCFVLAFVLWGMTCFEVVHPQEQGILEHWGVPTGRVLEPGVYVKYPWPVDHVRHLAARQISEIKLGFETTGEERKLNFVLWTRIHSAEEKKLILNEGQDLVSIDAYLYYTIRDPMKYAYTLQNPDAALEVLAYRELLNTLLPYTLNDLLSQDRGKLSDRLTERIQAVVKRQDLGIDVITVAFVGLHPPVDIADAYQDVVSAQIDQDSMRRLEEAQAYVTVPAALATAAELENAAAGAGYARTQDAAARAAQFLALLDVYRQDPFLVSTARKAETYESALAGRQFIVTDDAFDAVGHKFIWDFRRSFPLLPPFDRGGTPE